MTIPTSDLTSDTKQGICEARNRADSYIQDPLAAFFGNEVIRNANPVDSLLGLISSISGTVALTIKLLDLQQETSSNEELAETLGNAFNKRLLAVLEAVDTIANERTS